MHIEEQDSLEVFYFLQYEQERGMEWMLYNEQKAGVTAADIFCFATQDEMLHFRQQYPDFANHYKGTSIEPVVEAMTEIVELIDGQRLPTAVNIRVADCKLDRHVMPPLQHRHNLLQRKSNNNNVHMRRHL